ncbi:TetR-like C-terminal domain-containing protein [Lagierella sp.]|uniref:TetR/AcrR family transcriptional regulator n=1 Tax=Lagierella sp. TaxID=2849657 RepID=UPI0026326CD9|nr:TetR-like C-terminal domain-containing protein [Lagierella sp.]
MAKQYTKELIKKEFIKLVSKRPLKNITIDELSQNCEINRNTFYYHYEDIYMLVREILNDELIKLDEEFNNTLSWEESFILAISFILENKKATLNIFRSIDQQYIDNYLYETCGRVMDKFIENECKIKNIKPKEEDIKLIRSFYQFALIGFLNHWIEEGLKDDPQEYINRLGKLFEGNIERSLRISEGDSF